MPNWCSNTLTLRHKQPGRCFEVARVFHEGNFLNHFVPLPNGEWDYNWAIDNWGCKWDVGGSDSDVLAVSEHEVKLSFDSAWAPPTEAYRAMCEQGFEVEAFYYEPGMAFCGKWTGDENDHFDDYHEYGSESSETVRALIGDELDDHWGISESMAYYEEENEVDEQELIDDLERIRKLGPHTD